MDTNWVQPDTLLGWVCKRKEKLRFYNPKLSKNSYCINKQGFRNPFDFDSLHTNQSQKRILLLGDSFIFGILQSDSMTIPAWVQKSLGPEFQVFNLAIPAWGLDQMYLAYQRYLDVIQPDQVILFYIDDDISRLLEAFYWGATTKPSFKLVDGQLAKRELYENKLNYLESLVVFNSQIINRLYRYRCMKKAAPLAEAFILRMHEFEKSRDRQLAIVHCPRFFQLDGEKEPGHFALEPFLAEQSAEFYNLRIPMLQLSKKNQRALYDIEDGHLSDRGAAFVAEFLTEKVIRLE